MDNELKSNTWDQCKETEKEAASTESYPRNHAYNIFTLDPLGTLNTRYNVLQGMFEEARLDRTALDIGASKGFFTFSMARDYKKVVAWDNYSLVTKTGFKGNLISFYQDRLELLFKD